AGAHEQPIRQGALAVIDVGDDGEIPYLHGLLRRGWRRQIVRQTKEKFEPQRRAEARRRTQAHFSSSRHIRAPSRLRGNIYFLTAPYFPLSFSRIIGFTTAGSTFAPCAFINAPIAWPTCFSVN